MARPISRVLSERPLRFTGSLHAKPLGRFDKSSELTLHPSGINLSDHLSRPTRHRGVHAAYPKLKEDEQPPVRIRTSLLLGLAPDGGCLAADITVNAGGLLHHLFTLTRSNALMAKEPSPYPVDQAVLFCGPFRGSPHPGVTRHRALWSADFPQVAEATRDRPVEPSDDSIIPAK